MKQFDRRLACLPGRVGGGRSSDTQNFHVLNFDFWVTVLQDRRFSPGLDWHWLLWISAHMVWEVGETRTCSQFWFVIWKLFLNCLFYPPHFLNLFFSSLSISWSRSFSHETFWKFSPNPPPPLPPTLQITLMNQSTFPSVILYVETYPKFDILTTSGYLLHFKHAAT